MPELPELETIARSLREPQGAYHASIIGCSVARAIVLWERTLAAPTVEEFSKRIGGQTVQNISRRGKFLMFTLYPDTLFIHLRMSGDLRLENAITENGTEREAQTHDRLMLVFTNDMRLVFNDPRKFGRVWLLSDPEEVLGSIGPEPFDLELTASDFFNMLRARSRQLKPLLMDQRFLSGLGNIYTDEALHLAHLHPLTRTDLITRDEAARLLDAIRATLREGIRRNGASIDWVYRGGDFQNHFRVYRRAGEPCLECGTLIERLVVGQRGTHICPTCQNLR